MAGVFVEPMVIMRGCIELAPLRRQCESGRTVRPARFVPARLSSRQFPIAAAATGSSAVTGSMIVDTRATTSAGKPPLRA